MHKYADGTNDLHYSLVWYLNLPIKCKHEQHYVYLTGNKSWFLLVLFPATMRAWEFVEYYQNCEMVMSNSVVNQRFVKSII